MKICTRCGIEKELLSFRKDSKTIDHLNRSCRDCEVAFYYRNHERIRANQKRYQEKHKEKIAQINKSEHRKALYRASYERRKNKIRVAQKNHYEKNKRTLCKKSNEYVRKKRKTNPLFKFTLNIRGRMRTVFKNKEYARRHKYEDMIGGIAIARAHIERQFKKGMSWENYGLHGWHIDHIIPLASAKSEEDVIRLCHYTNLQPLWASDNYKKSKKIPQVQVKMAI